ncbi:MULTISPECIES: NAD-dependent succinate-semialdehyde dehydrogenase [unclassified Caballeronia]|uniref:NAD-dependent succinate-semialdehyde dehydrogenase n=1 Tax=unclassified Caballeronia TaxID=2646786 RepID=UPI002864E04E|nr:MULTISPECIES: NAD-dependent succinate-semialdehyde dehydrogenase [unclassified Caballeronia]MDR5818517.1 NAD-dependent succinate-semialdehyde dehydrogenase [Caballeronia sp. LZ033]MDR5825484.1 NAD-dependent succinate-semialdehyde dehydrogenase [Caballeronia sp. LZ043]MDR5883362.1 NAD-dependent succinate-semialdehyde dehydrogenase [Caballeronia sp. LZ032]
MSNTRSDLPAYPNVQLYIDGAWRNGSRDTAVINPASEAEIGRLALAGESELALAADAAARGFKEWRKVSPYERSKIMRRAAQIIRERAADIAAIMTMEQGKPLGEARIETLSAADIIEWFAEEGRRTYGRVIPSRADAVRQIVTREPVGPVAAFTPWNFPINQAVRKVSAALAAGCSVVLKGPEETPASCAALVQAYADAGVPAGVVNLVFGVPADVSKYLIAHPVIRKISFTGSTPVGKLLASMAGEHMKRVTMELGGHAPAIVFKDADIPRAAKMLAGAKFRNAGQVCISPTRFLVEEAVYEEFVHHFVATASAVKVGNGLEDGVQMGPLANGRRLEAMERLVADAREHGAKVLTGGERVGREGYFFAPTVLTDVPMSARIMTEEPFGPIAPIASFSSYDEVIAEANRLPYGLAAYGYTSSAATSAAFADDIESGMVSINHHGLGMPETPFGGVKDSGYGSEGGSEAMEAYLVTKFVTEHR